MLKSHTEGRMQRDGTTFRGNTKPWNIIVLDLDNIIAEKHHYNSDRPMKHVSLSILV